MIWYRNLNSEVQKKLFSNKTMPRHAFCENMGWLARQGFSDTKMMVKKTK